MPKDPESLGSGLGPLLADYLPLMPSGARRAGAAEVMAARIGRDPSVLVTDPLKTQALAMGLGGVAGVYAGGDTKRKLMVGAIPLLIVQALRRREMKSIQEDYDKKKRKRLRDVDWTDFERPGLLGGSHYLGATSALESMRRRQYAGFGPGAETGDMITILGGMNPATIPLTSLLDRNAAMELRKRADFADQKNSPTIPLYLAAALAGSLGQRGSLAWAMKELAKEDPLPTDKWDSLIQSVSGGKPVIGTSPGLNNAYFKRFATEAVARETARKMGATGKDLEAKVRQMMEHGLIVSDTDMPASVLAHEAGHAKIERTPGVARFLQRNIYPFTSLIAPVASVGSMAAGLASGSTLKGALYGTGLGLLGGVGQVVPEAVASYHGVQGLKSHDGGSLARAGDVRETLAALSTYLARSVLPSTLSGAAGGWISGRRRKRDEEQEKAASASRLLETLRKLRAAAAAEKQLKGSGDRMLRQDASLGLPRVRTALSTLWRDSETLRGGFPTKRPSLEEAVRFAEKAVAAEKLPARSQAQELFDFMKSGRASGDLDTLRRAKEHSDKGDYARKNLLLRQMMDAEPDAWVIDSDDGNGIVGVTHVPTGFRLHMPKDRVYHPILKRQASS